MLLLSTVILQLLYRFLMTDRTWRGCVQPGNCPLYSGTSELPANPFFATIEVWH